MTKDMTVGSPLGLILRFCGPMVFGNILQQLYSMVDTVIVGRYLGADALAGVGATGAISFLVVGFATGICTGLSIPVAQAFGAGDHRSMRKYIANAYYLSGIIAVLLTIVTMFSTGAILHWMKTPSDIYQYAYDYIIVIFGGIITSVIYNLLAAMLRAVGDSKSPILFLAVASILNIILDLIFLIVLKTGVAGAGYATVISQGISGILCLFYLYRKFEVMRFQHGEMKVEPKRCVRLLSIGLPMALQFSITAIGSIILQTSVNTLGSVAVTSVTAAQKIASIVMGPLESLGITMATYCGQNLGAGHFYRIRDGIRISLRVSMAYCVFSILFLCFLGKYTAYLFLDPSETEVIAQAVQYMRLNAIFFPVLGLLFILRNSLQGMGYSLMPMMAGVSELAARALVCFLFVPVFGYTAAAMASPVAWVFADVLLISVYFLDMRKLKRRLVPVHPA
ncbi:MAG: MATE family efflux transporter [Ruminococcus sp.]